MGFNSDKSMVDEKEKTWTQNIAPDKAAYLRKFVDLRTQLNSFLCVHKRNENPWYSIPNFFIAYDAIVFTLRLSFFASQAVVQIYPRHGAESS